jgi:hypothetical protein
LIRLCCVQSEWYEYAHDSTSDPVVDAYAQIQDLTEQVSRLNEELKAKTEFAEYDSIRCRIVHSYLFFKPTRKASGLFEKLRKERDFHKMHHRRVVEEKNKLIRDLKRLVKHNAKFAFSSSQLFLNAFYLFPLLAMSPLCVR